MPLLISESDAARGLLYTAAGVALVGEAVATYVGQPRTEPASGRRRARLIADSVLGAAFLRSRGDTSADRGTKQFLVLCILAAIAAAVYIPNDFPSMRAGANTWPTLAS